MEGGPSGSPCGHCVGGKGHSDPPAHWGLGRRLALGCKFPVSVAVNSSLRIDDRSLEMCTVRLHKHDCRVVSSVLIFPSIFLTLPLNATVK